MGKNKIFLLFGLVVLISCNKKNENILNNENQYSQNNMLCDSIIYELPEKTTNTLLIMLKDKNVSYCDISSAEDCFFTFSFPYNDKTLLSERDSLLILKTNVFLKLKDQFYPVVSIYDYTFSNIPRVKNAINDFNYCFIKVDSQGIIKGGFAY